MVVTNSSIDLFLLTSSVYFCLVVALMLFLLVEVVSVMVEERGVEVLLDPAKMVEAVVSVMGVVDPIFLEVDMLGLLNSTRVFRTVEFMGLVVGTVVVV